MNKTVVYTCIVDSYDELMMPVADQRCDYVCFVKKGTKTCDRVGVWEIRELDYENSDNTLVSRFPKINPHLVLPEYTYSLWIDGNISLADSYIYDVIGEKIRQGVKYSGLKHWARDCSYDEIKECIDARIEPRWRLVKSLIFLKKHYFPKHYGMNENNVIFRKHSDPDIIRFDELWWQLYLGYSHRDQILHAYCMRECGIEYDYLLPAGYCARNHGSFIYRSHEGPRKYFWHRHFLNRMINILIKKFI